MNLVLVLLFGSPGMQVWGVISSAALNTNIHVGIEMSPSCTRVEEDLPLYGVTPGER